MRVDFQTQIKLKRTEFYTELITHKNERMKTKNFFSKLLTAILFAVVVLASVPAWNAIDEYRELSSANQVQQSELPVTGQTSAPETAKVTKIILRYLTARF